MKRFQVFSCGDKPDFETDHLCEDYEHLYDMIQKKYICSLTEPEDRIFSRDLSPLVSLLNEMSETIAQHATISKPTGIETPDSH